MSFTQEVIDMATADGLRSVAHRNDENERGGAFIFNGDKCIAVMASDLEIRQGVDARKKYLDAYERIK